MSINVPLLRKTLEHIEAHPEEWNQEQWRCQTGMCFAGHAATIDGGVWEKDPTSSLLEATDEDTPPKLVVAPYGDGEWIDAEFRASRILGLDKQQARHLFHERNTLDDLRRIVGELIEQAEATP